MRLYRTPAGSWAGTQADAKALAKADATTWAEVEVPVDKPGLLAFLNEHKVGSRAVGVREGTVETQEAFEATHVAPEPPCLPAAILVPSRPMTGEATLARMDNPGVDVDGICETIGRARGYALKRYAGAVSVAFQGLSG